MTPNERSLLDLADNLAVELLTTGRSSLRRAAFGAAEERALQAVLTTAFAAMLRPVYAESAPGDYALIAHIFHQFVQQPPVANTLLATALDGASPDLPTLRTAFAACHDGATLPIDVDTAITAFHTSLVAELVQAASQPDSPLHNRVNLARQTTLQRDLPPRPIANRTEVSDSTIHGPVVSNNPGTITVRYGDDIHHLPAPVKLSWEERQAQRNRDELLTQVEAFWVKGVLHESLHNLARIELGFQTRPDVVQHPWETLVRLPNQEPRPLPAGTDIAQVFRDNHERLLILGAPGSGKTTTLLMLAEALVTTARNNADQPLPVVFQLSTWAEQKPPLDAWLVDELRKRYTVPPKVGQALIEQDALILLLDGLDEVGPSDRERETCVATINAFRAQHNVPLVVCSRTAEYTDLQERFQLAALEIQPLTPAQRDAYLAQAGAQLAPLRTALAHDRVLAELATSPLLLSVIALTYQDMPIDTLAGLDATTAQRRIWRDYVADRFARPRADVTSNREQLRAWLIWLARGMVAHGQQVFYIEYLQPTWLVTCAQQRWFQIITGLVLGSLFGLGSGLATGLVFGLDTGLLFGLISGLIFGLDTGRQHHITPVETLSWSWVRIFSSKHFRDQFIKRFVWGLFWGPAFGLGGSGLFVGLVIGLGGGLVNGLVVGPILEGLKGDMIKIRKRTNESIRRSLRSSIISVLIIGLVNGLVFGVVAGIIFGPSNGLVFGLVGGLGSGMGGGLIKYGGMAIGQHLALRWLLNRFCGAPRDFAAFLEEAKQLNILTRVGGGYRFYHRLLQEHFARDEQPQSPFTVAPILGPDDDTVPR